jgi:hypothetical protein
MLAISPATREERIPMAEPYRFVIETDRETAAGDLLTAGDEIRIEGYGPTPSPSEQGLAGAHVLEPVSLSIAVSTLSVLAYRIIEHWLRREEYGVQIDARTTPATISTIAGVPNGFVVVIEADGSAKTINASALTPDAFTNLLGGIIKGAGTAP